MALQFRDPVFGRDRISTKERSIVRVLLGGKALVTVRELSELTITEEPGRPSIVDLANGKIALAVARSRMRPGEAIEVRTPNATAAVRGTVIVVEVTPASGTTPGLAQAGPDYRPLRTSFTGEAVPVQAPSVVTNFHVLRGSIDITSPATPGALPINLSAGLSLSVTDLGLGQSRPIPSVSQLVQDLKAEPQFTAKADSKSELAKATALANAIAPPPPSQTQQQKQEQEQDEEQPKQPQEAPKEQAKASATSSAAPPAESASQPATSSESTGGGGGATSTGGTTSGPVGDDKGPVGDNKGPVGDDKGPVGDNKGPVGDKVTKNVIDSTTKKEETSPDVPDVLISTSRTLALGETLKTFSGTTTWSYTSPVVKITGSGTTVDGSGTLIKLAPGANVSLKTGSGPLLQASEATVTANEAVKVEDNALLQATAPLISLLNGSKMTSNSDLVKLVKDARLVGTVPSDALVKLNASTLNVTGSLFNVAGGSQLTVTGITGSLVSLANGSTLSISNGALVAVSGGSVFTLTGGSLGVFGAGTNALNITNNTSLCLGCSITTSIPNFSYPVLLTNGALALKVVVTPGFVPFQGLSGTNTVNVSGASGAVLKLDGPTSSVALGP